MKSTKGILWMAALLLDGTTAFVNPKAPHVVRLSRHDTANLLCLSSSKDNGKPPKTEEEKEAALQAAIDAMFGGAPLESPQETRQRIDEMVNENSVVLFMKGNKAFPQCGFSDTATKILEQLKVTDYTAVDVLSDESIRQGIKDYSQWPTIPQLYVNGEFIGGSDIMLEMFQNGELASILKSKASDDDA